jgi:hypothetical protein
MVKISEFKASINKLKARAEVYKQHAIFSNEDNNKVQACRSLGYYLGLEEAISEMSPYIDKLKEERSRRND